MFYFIKTLFFKINRNFDIGPVSYVFHVLNNL
jgi:hypothetical protein